MIITSPEARLLYLGGRRVLPFPTTLVIGRIQISINASNDDSGISSVTFSLNGVVQKTTTTPHYIWDWTEKAFGWYRFKMEAIDGAGNKATVQEVIWRCF